MKFTRILALLLTVTMLFTGMVLPTVAEDGEEEEEYTPVYTIEDLYCIRYDLDGNFKLMNDIDMTADVAEGGDWDAGHGWDPIGAGESTAFTGTFDGQGYTITGLRIENLSTGYAGLFGRVDGGTLKNLCLKNVTIYTGIVSNGALAGSCINGSVYGVSVENADISTTYVYGKAGGIVGYLTNSSISSCYASCAVQSQYAAGGIVGFLATGSNISTCYATGTVQATSHAGGIAGNSYNGYNTISDSYSLVEVNGNDAAGICGHVESGSITISNCISYGTVSAVHTGAAICGYRESGIVNVSHCYYLAGTATQGWAYNTDTATTCVALTAAQSKLKSVYGYLDFENVWFFDKSTGIEHPQLRAVPETPQTPAEPTGLSVAVMPTHLICVEGGTPDLTGGKLQITDAEGGSVTVDMATAMIASFDSSRVGTQPVTLNYQGQTVSFDLTVVHAFADTVVPAACKMSGYTLHTCSVCGHQTISDMTEAAGHDFGEWVELGNGYVQRTCSRCSAVETEKVTVELTGDLNGDGTLSVLDVTTLLLMLRK